MIHLPEHHERRREFESRNRNLVDYEWFDAIDGNNLDAPTLTVSGLISNDLVMKPGAVGVAMSFISLLKKCISENRIITILEDDAVLVEDFDTRCKELIDSIKSQFDVIHWGWNFDSILHVYPLGINHKPMRIVANQDGISSLLDEFLRSSSRSCLLPLGMQYGMMCSTYSPEGAEKILRTILPLNSKSFTIPELGLEIGVTGFDAAMGKVYSSIRAFTCFPPLAISENDKKKSTIWTESTTMLTTSNNKSKICKVVSKFYRHRE